MIIFTQDDIIVIIKTYRENYRENSLGNLVFNSKRT